MSNCLNKAGDEQIFKLALNSPCSHMANLKKKKKTGESIHPYSVVNFSKIQQNL